MENVKITLVKSLITRTPAQIAVAKSLGLRKPGDSNTVVLDDANKGKIRLISFLVKVETV